MFNFILTKINGYVILFPLGLAEIVGLGGAPPLEAAETFVRARMDAPPFPSGSLEALLTFGGFPEPFTRQSAAFLAKWSRDYADVVVKEDIGALTRIIDREYLHDLYRLLPEMTGSPVSEASLAAHIQISPPTIKNHLRRMEDFFLCPSVPVGGNPRPGGAGNVPDVRVQIFGVNRRDGREAKSAKTSIFSKSNTVAPFKAWAIQ